MKLLAIFFVGVCSGWGFADILGHKLPVWLRVILLIGFLFLVGISYS